MDCPLSLLKIICLANTLIFHRGSSAFTRRIVYFQLFGSSVFIQLEIREDRPLWPGSSSLTHRSSALTPDRLLWPMNRLLWLKRSSALTSDRLLSSFPGSSALTLKDRPLSTVLYGVVVIWMRCCKIQSDFGAFNYKNGQMKNFKNR